MTVLLHHPPATEQEKDFCSVKKPTFGGLVSLLLAQIPWGACISGGLSPPCLSAREVLAVIALFETPASRSPVPGQLYPRICMEILIFKKHFVSSPSNFSGKHMAVVKTHLWLTFSRWKENTETVESAGRELLHCQSAWAAIQQDLKTPTSTAALAFGIQRHCQLQVSNGSHSRTQRGNGGADSHQTLSKLQGCQCAAQIIKHTSPG